MVAGFGPRNAGIVYRPDVNAQWYKEEYGSFWLLTYRHCRRVE